MYEKAAFRTSLNTLKHGFNKLNPATLTKYQEFSHFSRPNNAIALNKFDIKSPSIAEACSPLLATFSKPTACVSSRTVVKFSLRKGKRQAVGAVTDRFFRLHWGAWIRTIAARHRGLWKKSHARRRRIRQHVFCNSTQNKLLDAMVTRFWRKPKYYVDDPYEPYHTREEFRLTRKKPLVRD